MKIRKRKQLYFIFAILSLLIAGLMVCIAKQTYLPYEFRLDKQTPSNFAKSIEKYTDLDNDGISEYIKLDYLEKNINYYIKVYDSQDTLIKEFKFDDRINYRWLLFADYNNDNYKEIFAFSQLDDSLYLSIMDVKKKRFIIRRQFILSKPDSAKKDFWDIDAKPIVLLENDKSKELIFYVRGGSTIYPRTVYSYDINKKIFTSKFITGARLFETELIDINNNNKREIILSTSVMGNMKKKIGYHDRTGWLFVLDEKLAHVFPPKNFGSFPGDNHIVHFKKNNKSFFYVIYFNKTDSGKVVKSILFNSTGKELPHSDKFDICFRLPLKVTENDKDFIYIANDNRRIFKLNSNLEIVKYNELNCQSIDFIKEINIGRNNQKALLIRGTKQICLVDKELNLLAKYDLGENFWRICLKFEKLNGKNNLPQLPILTTTSNYLFTIIESKIHLFLPLIFIGISLFTFLLLVGFHKLLSFFSTYIKYFTFSLNKSSKGVALFNSSGKLFYSNKNVSEYLDIKESAIKKESYKNIFHKRNDVLSAIEKSIITQNKISKELHISTPNCQFEGSLTITPFRSFIGYTYAYLMEVSDFTEPLLTDRGKVWGATLQRIAHEIKTPLSTLILSLDNLKNRLVGKDIDVNDEIIMMQSELERIKQLTKNFMMFTNLEQQNWERVSLSKTLNESINIFSSYFEKTMTLKYIDNNFYVIADKRQLSQLFPLLIENAIDACSGKGIIDIKCEPQGIRRKTYDNNSKNEFIKITISDNGNGMSDEISQKIFEPYFTTKKDGTGMGLSLAKKIIEDNRGRLEINSTEDAGTEVIVYLQTDK